MKQLLYFDFHQSHLRPNFQMPKCQTFWIITSNLDNFFFESSSIFQTHEYCCIGFEISFRNQNDNTNWPISNNLSLRYLKYQLLWYLSVDIVSEKASILRIGVYTEKWKMTAPNKMVCWAPDLCKAVDSIPHELVVKLKTHYIIISCLLKANYIIYYFYYWFYLINGWGFLSFLDFL